MFEDELSLENIAMWGPTSSGKSWLIRAFAKELDIYTKTDDKFDYVLSLDTSKVKVIAEPPSEITGNDDFLDHLYRFERRPKKGLDDAKYQVSSQSHLINIRDLPGAWSIGVAEDPDAFDEILLNYINSKYLIAVFDPTFGSSGGFSNPKEVVYDPGNKIEYANRRDYDKDTYSKLFNRFIDLLLDNTNSDSEIKQRFVAIALTKMDKIPQRRLPVEIISGKFGPKIRELLGKYLYKPGQDVSTQPLVVNVFNTSSAGYIRDRVPNIDPDDPSKILKDDKWHPDNAVAPFFWIFEMIERQRLARGQEKKWGLFGSPVDNYIPYPKRKIF